MEQHLTQFAQICPCLPLISPLKLLQPRGDGLLVQRPRRAESHFGMFVHTVAHNLINLPANWFPSPLANRPNKASEGLSVWCVLGTLEPMQRAWLLMKLLSAEGHRAHCSGDEPSALGHFALLLCFSLSFSQTEIISKVLCSIIKVYKIIFLWQKWFNALHGLLTSPMIQEVHSHAGCDLQFILKFQSVTCPLFLNIRKEIAN